MVCADIAQIYSYIFRLQTTDDAQPAPTADMASRPRSAASHSSAHSGANHPAPAALPPPQAASQPITEGERLVRILKAGVNQQETLNSIYTYCRGNPTREAEVQAAISAHLKDTLQMYVLRALQSRKEADKESGAGPTGPPAARGGALSPRRPESGISGVTRLPSASAGQRKSLAPRQSTVAVDKSAPINDQLAQYKNWFATIGSSQTSNGGAGGAGRGEEPLRERAAPNADSSID